MGSVDSMSVEILPAAPANALSPVHPPNLTSHESSPALENDSEPVRSASYTNLAVLNKAPGPEHGLKRTFSENVLGSLAPSAPKISPSLQTANTELFRRASKSTKKRMSWVSTTSVESIEVAHSVPKDDEPKQRPSKITTRSVSGALKSVSLKSWLPSSRSGSQPNSQPASRSTSPTRASEARSLKKLSSSPKKKSGFLGRPIAVPDPVAHRRHTRNSPSQPTSELTDSKPICRRQSPSPDPKSRAVADLSSKDSSTTSSRRLSRQSSATSLRSKSSTDCVYLDIPGRRVPPIPTSTSADGLSTTSSDSGRKRDPLWSAFRSIEGEWASFQQKTGLQRAKIIRSVLLPFLSSNADHPSNDCLRAEDLDRRVHILNKWWSGLLELLNGRSNQSISGTDRPAFLEAVTEIMLRSEWRTPPFPRASGDIVKTPRPAPANVKWTYSIESDSSDFLIESIYQNTRNIFTQNLLSQIAYVVDRLSMRSAPASLVNFGGKTCAYAFFFCPGVADILVRLWHLHPSIVRRVFSEYGALHSRNGRFSAAELADSFPPAVRSLSLPSQGALTRHIQPKVERPPGSDTIRWYGPWTNRWIGRDSDLFFIFVKYYHILVCEFCPITLTQEERVNIPGLVPIHAQLLSVLEASLYRHVGHFSAEAYTVGDSMDSMPPMAMTIPNATRTASENRLVILLRDLVGDSAPPYVNVAELVVSSFDLLLKAATKKISMYNTDASFVLCDLIEEICPTLCRYRRTTAITYSFDWDFYTRALKLMMQSHGTLTQIRAIALIYTMWPTLTSDEEKKRMTVVGWILEPKFFSLCFNHWAAMVRHYFQRLLCWRVARCDGVASELDIEILQTLSNRLKTTWAGHQHLVAEAEVSRKSPPSTEPCMPAPGRTITISRTEKPPTSPSFSTFDKILSSNQAIPYRNHLSQHKPSSAQTQDQVSGKKRWNLFRGMNPFATTSPSDGRPGEVTPPASPENAQRRKAAEAGSRRLGQSPPDTPPQHMPSAYHFSLEHTSARPQLPQQRHRKLETPVLPTNAQKLLDDLAAIESPERGDRTPPQVSQPHQPGPDQIMTARYSGRALAEWAQVVSECRTFYIRRRQEGCHQDDQVETPTMTVESFKMFG